MENTLDDIRYSFYEIDEILKNIPDEFTNKLPNKFKDLINKNKLKNDFIYDKSKSLDNQLMLRNTKILLSVLYRNFLCSDEEKEFLEENDEKILNEKYDSDNLFKNKKVCKNELNEKLPVVVKEKWYIKILNFLRKCKFRNRP